jgi:hypothetical protein
MQQNSAPLTCCVTFNREIPRHECVGPKAVMIRISTGTNEVPVFDCVRHLIQRITFARHPGTVTIFFMKFAAFASL